MKQKPIVTRLLAILVGVTIMAIGTALCRITAFGIDPFNALCVGVSDHLHIPSGTGTLLLQAILAAVVLKFDRQYLGIGTLIPVAIFGYLLQFFTAFLPTIKNDVMLLKVAIFALGIFVTTFGMAIYMTCDLGMVPYDCISFLISKSHPFATRIIIDASVAALAFILGGPISVGTIIFALGTGPLIAWFQQHIISPALLRVL